MPLPSSLIKTNRFRIAFATWWCCWTGLHLVILLKFAVPSDTAIYDAVISNTLLGGAVLLVAISLQYYLPSANRYRYVLALCTTLSILFIFVSRGILMMVLANGSDYESFFFHSLLLRGATGFLSISCMALIAVLWYTIQDQQEIEKRKTEAERLSKDAELNNLRQQLQPHFLFNSLNSINALIGMQPQQARTMIQQLSDFLRGTLNKEQKEWTSLADELQQLNLYLEIEKVRFGHRLETNIVNQASTARLPVMLLQPVVENAIKFGLYDTTGNIVISINAKQETGYLEVVVTNPFDAETSMPKKGTGFGLSSVQRRLYLLFARNDLLQTTVAENLFITTIKIPQP